MTNIWGMSCCVTHMSCLVTHKDVTEVKPALVNADVFLNSLLCFDFVCLVCSWVLHFQANINVFSPSDLYYIILCHSNSLLLSLKHVLKKMKNCSHPSSLGEGLQTMHLWASATSLRQMVQRGWSGLEGLFISLCLTSVKRTSIQTLPSYDNLSFNVILHTWLIKWDVNTMKMVNRLAGWMPDL